MNEFVELVHEIREPMPLWLEQFADGGTFELEAFLASRLVYYPMSGQDYRPIEAFGLSGAAHCFIHADCGIPKDFLVEHLEQDGLDFSEVVDFWDLLNLARNSDDPEAIKAQISKKAFGYDLEKRIDLDLKALFPSGDSPVFLEPDPSLLTGVGERVQPYAFLAVFSKRGHHPLNAEWPELLAVMFLGTEALATYEDIFGRPGQHPPFAVKLAAGMHAYLGNGGPFSDLALRTGTLPEWLLVDDGVLPWDGFDLEAPGLFHRSV